MERIQNLGRYQKGLLIFMAAMTLIFAVIYPSTISKVGYRFNDRIFVPSEENGNTLYRAKVQGKQAQFTVSGGNTVVLHYGDRTYGPYTVTEDATAIPKDRETQDGVTGIEVRQGDELLFRGGVTDFADSYWLYSEDGSSGHMIEISYMTGDGIERDENGDPIDKMKPSVLNIYELVSGPELTHKGDGLAWFGAVFVCVINTVLILFADELFRWNLAFQIRDPQYAEPSDWEIAGRYIGWTSIALAALIVFVMGLQ